VAADVEPFATWSAALSEAVARAYALITAHCVHLIVLCDALLSDSSTEEKAKRILAARTILCDFIDEVRRTASIYHRIDRLREIYERESALAKMLESEANPKFEKSWVELAERAARARFRARCAFTFASALEKIAKIEVYAQCGLDAPHSSWREEEFRKRLLMSPRAWRLGAARLLAAQLASELAGGRAHLHEMVATLAADLAPFASFEKPPPPAGLEVLAELDDRIEQALDELERRRDPSAPRDPASKALKRALLSLEYLNLTSRLTRLSANRALKALEELRELQPIAAVRRAYAETWYELARLNVKRVELGLEPRQLPAPPDEPCADPGECRYCPLRGDCDWGSYREEGEPRRGEEDEGEQSVCYDYEDSDWERRLDEEEREVRESWLDDSWRGSWEERWMERRSEERRWDSYSGAW